MPEVFSIVSVAGRMASVEGYFHDGRVMIQYEDGWVEVVNVSAIQI